MKRSGLNKTLKENIDFIKAMGRFPSIEEDEAPLYLLCNEYPKAK